ncbi:MAG TPA: efflux RND transporter periplasmic adaptor subunit [Acidobacteriaceae bacterium]|jgi:HlyD family secretion protein|nr:efflux RND transporter periplasmic adaptor subunit [Acidobacteriaceae bacterium]
MSTKKILLVVLGAVVLIVIVAGSIVHSRNSVTAVTTAKAVRQDLTATVSGTGQIKPLTEVNLGATAFGRITHLYVKEGDHVKKGQLVATVESEQPASQVQAQEATINSQRTTVDSYVAAEKTAEAAVQEAKADLEQKRFDIERYNQLYKDQLVAKQDYDAKKAAYDIDVATLAQRVAALAQAKAQTAAARSQVTQAVATLHGNDYQLGLTESRAPFDGLVTNIPVHENETVVVGIQNAEGSTLMTLADMSIITAEVKVDETDIVNIQMGQPADVSVDAFPGQILKGHVTEVGDQALLRTTGVATSQSTTGTEEAKDFKVVVTLDPQTAIDLRPGLSCNARITTAHKPDVLTVPIQSLVERDATAEETLFRNHGKESSNTASAATRASDTQGVFVLVHDHGAVRVRFVPVSTGVIGATDIEVLSGLKPGDEIVTGRYKTLRTLKSGTAVKVDNSLTLAPDTSS